MLLAENHLNGEDFRRRLSIHSRVVATGGNRFARRVSIEEHQKYPFLPGFLQIIHLSKGRRGPRPNG